VTRAPSPGRAEARSFEKLRYEPPAAIEGWRRRCRICGGFLGRDRPITAIACSCHPGGDEQYELQFDRYLDERVLSVLIEAVHGGRPVNVARMFGTKDRKRIWRSVRRLRKAGWPIVGVRGSGYELH
jgi:hypothetical protein